AGGGIGAVKRGWSESWDSALCLLFDSPSGRHQPCCWGWTASKTLITWARSSAVPKPLEWTACCCPSGVPRLCRERLSRPARAPASCYNSAGWRAWLRRWPKYGGGGAGGLPPRRPAADRPRASAPPPPPLSWRSALAAGATATFVGGGGGGGGGVPPLGRGGGGRRGPPADGRRGRQPQRVRCRRGPALRSDPPAPAVQRVGR